MESFQPADGTLRPIPPIDQTSRNRFTEGVGCGSRNEHLDSAYRRSCPSLGFPFVGRSPNGSEKILRSREVGILSLGSAHLDSALRTRPIAIGFSMAGRSPTRLEKFSAFNFKMSGAPLAPSPRHPPPLRRAGWPGRPPCAYTPSVPCNYPGPQNPIHRSRTREWS